MTDDTCTACHDRPRDGDTYLCQSCADDFHAHIAELPTLAKELETELVRDTQKGSPQHGRSTELPLPFSPAASDLLHELRFWAVTTLEQFTPRDVRLEPRWEALSALLAAREAWIVKFPTAGDVVRSLASLRAEARQLIDVPPERIYLGECDCGAPIRPTRDAAIWRCPTITCGANWNTQELIDYRNGVAQDHLVTYAEAKLLLPQLKKSTFWAWVDRKRIFPRSTNDAGAKLFRYGEIVDLHRKTLARGA